MPPRRRALTDHERADWAAYVRTIRKLPGQVIAADGVIADALTADGSGLRAAAAVHPPIVARAISRPSLPPLSIGLQPPGIDNATWQRFKAGRLAPSRTLDLHGQTVQSAFHSLHDFVRRAHLDHQRCVEVITGRGAKGHGVLRRELPIWLNMSELRPLLLGMSHPHAGNDGAVRLLVRRIR